MPRERHRTRQRFEQGASALEVRHGARRHRGHLRERQHEPVRRALVGIRRQGVHEQLQTLADGSRLEVRTDPADVRVGRLQRRVDADLTHVDVTGEKRGCQGSGRGPEETNLGMQGAVLLDIRCDPAMKGPRVQGAAERVGAPRGNVLVPLPGHVRAIDDRGFALRLSHVSSP